MLVVDDPKVVGGSLAGLLHNGDGGWDPAPVRLGQLAGHQVGLEDALLVVPPLDQAVVAVTETINSSIPLSRNVVSNCSFTLVKIARNRIYNMRKTAE